MRKNIFLTILSILLVVGLVASGVFVSTKVVANSRGTEYVDVLISFKHTPSVTERNLVRGMGGSIKHSYTLVPGIAARIPSSALKGLERNPNVVAIEPDGIFSAIDYAVELDNSWGVKHIRAGEVHEQGYLGEGVKVAVIDTGIDYSHMELGGVYAGGYDFVNGDNDPMDDNGHGTHVAGIIAAVRDGIGVVGVAPEIELYGLKVLAANGGGSFSDVIAALQWAVENGVQITNNSYGSSGDPGTIVKEAFDNSYNAGVLHIAAAGNGGNPAGRGDSVSYPAKWESVIAVAATGTNDRRASWSSMGPSLELSAPGVSIYSTWLNGGYQFASGTSMASPHVVGVAALIIGDGNTNIFNVRTILQSTAKYLGSFTQYGYGLVDALDAVGAELPPENPPGDDDGGEEDKCPPGWAKRGIC